jgi:hypothetical protein
MRTYDDLRTSALRKASCKKDVGLRSIAARTVGDAAVKANLKCLGQKKGGFECLEMLDGEDVSRRFEMQRCNDNNVALERKLGQQVELRYRLREYPL